MEVSHLVTSQRKLGYVSGKQFKTILGLYLFIFKNKADWGLN